MLEGFEPGVIPALKLIMRITQDVDKEVYDILTTIGDIPTFTLSWLLTWFSHILPDFI